MTNKLENKCKKDKLQVIEQDWLNLVQNKENKDQVMIRIQDVIAFCFREKCEHRYDWCDKFHEEIATILLQNKPK